MTDLERFAAALLAQWRADEGKASGPLTVALLIDRVLPYRLARRLLGIDVSEDYEALVLRLLAEEGRLVVVTPVGAAEMARTTMASKLPDLGVLQLLRSATVAFTDDTLARLDGILPLPAQKKEEPKWAPAIPAAAAAKNDIIVLPVAHDATVAPASLSASPSAESPSPPSDAPCWSCGDLLPGGRQVKFCPFCGADQRQPKCATCGEAVERRWRHCPECGTKLWGG